MEKLEIERRYWEMQGVQWTLVVNEGLNTMRALNLDWLFNFELALGGNVQIDDACVQRILHEVRNNNPEAASTVCRNLDRVWRTPMGAHITAFRFLLFVHVLNGNLEVDIFVNQPLGSFRS